MTDEERAPHGTMAGTEVTENDPSELYGGTGPEERRTPVPPSPVKVPGSVEGNAYGAVVFVCEEVRWHAATRTRRELFVALGSYVAGQAPVQLWPADAARVKRWLHRGEPEKAIRYYFAAVGRRWDRERLHLALPDEPVGATTASPNDRWTTGKPDRAAAASRARAQG